MNVRKFVAGNARDALRKVKETLGPDAVILSNRAIAGGVEIMAIAAHDMARMVPPEDRSARRPAPPPPPPIAAPPARSRGLEPEEDYHVTLSARGTEGGASSRRAGFVPGATGRPISQGVAAAVRGASEPPPAPRPPLVNAAIPRSPSLQQSRSSHAAAHPPPGTPPKPEMTMDGVPVVMEEIRSLRKVIEQHLAGFAWGEASRTEPIKTEVLRQMLDVGFSPQFARELLSDLPREMDKLQALAWIRGITDRNLLTLGVEHDLIDRGGVYALLGPTGVGKTTTTAKLAARCVLRHGANKVALITTDSYRIGAHEQLRIYGRILGVTVYLAKDADELQQILVELKHKHMVLIDTMGMSQKDKLVEDLNAMLVACGVRRLLVLSATSRGDTLDDVVLSYRGDDLAGCVLTKIDEAASLAPALDVIMRHTLKLHYISNGQRVPEDLHLPNRAYLLHRAFKPQQSLSPHQHDGLESGLVMANAGLSVAGG